MKKTYIKTIIREIKESFGRFTAIFAIVALGVGFLAGLLATTPDMKASVDRYYDKNNMADIFIKATMGLTEEDIKAVSSIEGVKQVMPAYVTDTLMETDSGEVLASRIFGLPLHELNDNDNGFINRLELIEGRMPQARNECLVERSGNYLKEIKIGTTLTISEENDDYEDIGDIYKDTEYTVVGIVGNPFYFSKERETTGIGSGKVEAIVYVDESNYALDAYTDFYITVSGAAGMTAFTEEYEAYVEKIVSKLESAGKVQSRIRYNDVLKEAQEEIEEAKEKLADEKRKAEKELADGWQEIEKARAELADAWRKIQDGKAELVDAKITLNKKRADAQAEIDKGKQELNDAKIELEDGEKELTDALIELEDGQRQYDKGYKEYKDARKELLEAQKEFDKGEQEYLDGVKELANGYEEIKRGERELENAKAQLQTAEEEYNAGIEQLKNQKSQFDQLMNPILAVLSYPTSEDLFNAMEQDTSGEVSTAVTSVLTASRSTIEEQIAGLQGQITGLEEGIGQLEAQIGEIENGTSEPPEGKTLEELKEDLSSKRMELETARANLTALEESLAKVPASAAELQKSWKALKDGEKQLENAYAEISAGWNSYYSSLDELEKAKKEYYLGKARLEEAGEELEKNRRKLEDAWDELEDGRKELEKARRELEDGYAQAEDARKELDDGWAKYYSGLEELANAEETMKKEIAKANREIQKAEEDLAKGERDYEQGLQELKDGEAEYFKSKADAERELADGARKIADSEKELEDLEMPEWYVLDRSSNVSYASFSINVEKVAAIAKVFPIFFFLVAALVALTTMTRMVEEERTQIGTLKALGYGKGIIMFKYMVYCGLATVLGSAAGLIGGFRLLPTVLWNAYGLMYHLPPLVTELDWNFALIASALAVLCTMAATVSACSLTLREKPSRLMLPRAPKAGKRIFLEHIHIIWSRMKFSHKATARNLLRYKKHFFMTVIGIAGCTALIVTGFGLRNSVEDIAKTQFDEIIKYDLLIEMEEDETFDKLLQDFLSDKSKVHSYTEAFSEKGYAECYGERVSVTVYVPRDPVRFNEFITLRERKSGRKILFDDSSVVVTEKLAETLGIKPGDSLTLEDADGHTAEFIVSGITENYVGSYVYINETDYSSSFGEEVSSNTLMVKTPVKDLGNQDELLKALLASDTVLNAEFTSQTKKSFDNLMSSINFIVIVLILAAGALAVIVLYNLTNININERKKELATLKVLGFHNEEVGSYIFRETSILTVIGTLVGLFLGVLLHAFVIRTGETTDMMFGRSISASSFVLSIVITFFFSAVVDLIMYKKLKKIEMVDSLKAFD